MTSLWLVIIVFMSVIKNPAEYQSRESGGAGYSTLFWIGMCRWGSKTLTLFKTLDIEKSIPYSRQIGKKAVNYDILCQQVSGNLTWRRASLIILRTVPYLRHKNMIWLVIWQNYRSCSRQFRAKCIPCLRQQGQKPYPIQRHIPV